MFGNMTKTVEYSLGNATLYISPFPPFEAIALLGDLQRLIGPALGKGLSAFAGGDGDNPNFLGRKVDAALLAEAFAVLAQTVDGHNLQAAVRKVLNPQYVSVRIGGRDAVQLDEGMVNTIFTANLGDMFLLVGKVLEVTYGDFFGKLIGRIGNVGAAGRK